MSEENNQTETLPPHEWTKFIVLAVILVGTIFVLLLARPFIFNRVVPAVMGEGQLTAPIPVAEPEEATKEAYPAGEIVIPIIVEETAVQAAYPAENAPVIEEEMATAVAPLSHTVQPGDTLLNIARRYGITVETIIAANNISNPNHIEVGTTLVIPQ
ncbi:MAG: LysM peptidoglycan-binding domain-containing protein [Ardenticatenaceae bacterium]|nr:LysM peptidoglycan-binding domain-containing protein [Ardenticatenaceae bacterium]MCB9444131.1 LysM peptidoglycan-binding domain-containing protein [Ardenticatenaceae bacterium]